MKATKKMVWLFLASLLLGCHAHRSWSKMMQLQVNRHYPLARQVLLPLFKRKGLSFPPQQMALIVYKRSRQMELWVRQSNQWYFIKRYKIFAASGHAGPKLRQGDHQVPEGLYKIQALNPFSHYTLSMKLSYPNAFDRHQAEIENRHHLGGNIFIHGKKSSIGCLAIGNKAIKELFVLTYMTGKDNVRVIIAPKKWVRGEFHRIHPRKEWVFRLYQKIHQAIQAIDSSQ